MKTHHEDASQHKELQAELKELRKIGTHPNSLVNHLPIQKAETKGDLHKTTFQNTVKF